MSRISHKVLLVLILIAIFAEPIGKSKAFVSQGEEAPDFTLMSIYNESITLSNYRGKIVLLDFWATWCGPCQEEIKELSKLYELYRDEGLVIISINLREDIYSVRNFAERNEMNWVVVLDRDGNVTIRYGVVLIPTLILLNEDGKIAYINTGFIKAEDLAQEVKALGRFTINSKVSILFASIAVSFSVIVILIIIRTRIKNRSALEKVDDKV